MLTEQDIYQIVSTFAKQGATADKLSYVLSHLKNGGGELSPKLSQKIAALINGIEIKGNDFKEKVEKWVSGTTGHWSVTDGHRYFNLVTTSHKHHFNMIVTRLKEKGIIEPYGNKSGVYCLADTKTELLDYKNVDMKQFDITLPLGLNYKTAVFPKSIIVVAGVTGHGKTALALNIVHDNMFNHKINYLASEASAQSLREQMSLFSLPIDAWKFSPYSKTKDFHTHTLPDGITVIDYLTDYEGFYMIPAHIDKIFERLKKGVAIILVQKKSNAAYGRSGELGAERASLYIGLEFQKITVVKNRFRNRDQFRGLDTRNYDLKNGCAVCTSGWYNEDAGKDDNSKKSKSKEIFDPHQKNSILDPDFPHEEEE